MVSFLAQSLVLPSPSSVRASICVSASLHYHPSWASLAIRATHFLHLLCEALNAYIASFSSPIFFPFFMLLQFLLYLVIRNSYSLTRIVAHSLRRVISAHVDSHPCWLPYPIYFPPVIPRRQCIVGQKCLLAFTKMFACRNVQNKDQSFSS